MVRSVAKRHVAGAAGFGAGAGEAFAAERLHADDGADHAPVDVAIADLEAREDVGPGLVEAAVDAEGQAMAGSGDLVENPVEPVGASARYAGLARRPRRRAARRRRSPRPAARRTCRPRCRATPRSDQLVHMLSTIKPICSPARPTSQVTPNRTNGLRSLRRHPARANVGGDAMNPPL